MSDRNRQRPDYADERHDEVRNKYILGLEKAIQAISKSIGMLYQNIDTIGCQPQEAKKVVEKTEAEIEELRRAKNEILRKKAKISRYKP